MTLFFNKQSFRLASLITLKFLKRNIPWVIFVIVIVFFMIFLQAKFGIFFAKNILSEGFIGTYQEHDLPIEVLRLISQGLVKADEAGRLKPNLVNDWQVNNDATEFKFQLKDNLYWSDGARVKSSDLDFSIPDTQVSFPDDKTIDFKLKEAYSPFPGLLTKPIVRKNTLIGIGPYTITKIEKSRIFITKLTLKPQQINMPILYIRFYPNEKVGLTGFSLGEIEGIFGLNSNKDFSNNSQIQIRQITDFSKIVTIVFNNKDSIFSNRSIRQVLSYLAPEIKDKVEANNPYPNFYWAYNPDSKKYLSNRKEAEAALARAKNNIPDDKLKEGIILTSAPHLEQIGNQIVNEWKSLGFDAKVRVEPGIPQNFKALLITQSIPPDPDQYLLWHSSQEKTNLSKYSSLRVDKDLEEGRKAIKEEDRKVKYFDFQKTLLEDAPAVFLYFPKYNIVYLKKAETLLQKVLDLQLPKS